MYSSKVTDEVWRDFPDLSWEDLEPAALREHDQFGPYFNRWIKYYPKQPYHVKRGYNWGFAQQKTKKGNPAALHGDYLIRCVERHLSNYDWAEEKIYHELRQTKERLIVEGMDEQSAIDEAGKLHPIGYDYMDDRPYWLGLLPPRMTTDHCIDLDAKRYEVGRYEHNGIIKPVVCPGLEHFQTLKRVYDHFPRRIWCISSLTLGLHAWKKHRLRITSEIHAETKQRLEEIGLRSVEVHPMQGRCFRRPFGRDYLVITPERTLSMWQEQVTYYEEDARTAPFDRIVEAMLDQIDRSQRRYWWDGKVVRKLPPLLIDRRLDDIRRWRDNGFTERLTVPGCSSPPAAAAEPIAPAGGDRVGLGKVSPGGLPVGCSERDRSWPLWVERMAIAGLVAHDSVGHVVHELAKWLYWVELFDQPVVERAHQIEGLLEGFVLTRHNGFVTRLNDGNERNLLSQVRAAVTSASRIKKPESLELFERLRASRSQGKYGRLIQIVPILNGCTQENVSSPSSPFLTSYMFINKETVDRLPPGGSRDTEEEPTTGSPAEEGSPGTGESSPMSSSLTTYMFINKDTLLPPVLESEVEQIARDHHMRRRGDEYPLVRFARCLLNTLWERGGTSRLSNEVLVRMVGTSNPNQQVAYRKLLQEGGLIQEGDGEDDYLGLTWDLLNGDFSDTNSKAALRRQRSSYQPRAFSKTYSLSQRSMKAFKDYCGQFPENATAEPLGALEPNK